MPIRPQSFKPPGWRPAPRRKTVDDPYYHSQQWRDLRAYVLERDGFQCTEPNCRTPQRGHGGRLVAGHIVARRDGGKDEPANVRTFCVTCDGRFTGRRHRVALA